MASGAVIPLTIWNLGIDEGVSALGSVWEAPLYPSGTGGGRVSSVRKSNALITLMGAASLVYVVDDPLVNFRTSVNLPVIAAAAAIAGLRRCVLPPAP